MTEDNMSQDELAQFSQYISQESGEIELSVTRDPEEDFFYEEDMEKFYSDIKTFIAARMMGAWPLTGEPFSTVKVKISVEIA